MFEHRRGAGFGPSGGHPPDVHVPPIERSRGGMLVIAAVVGIPDLDRGVHVQNAAVVAPLEDFAAVDVPGQVDDQVAGRDVLFQFRTRDSRE